jgi:2-polyprenyl-3-methyl-5-hydroxy-6-metoxy-1,4-benzoquinol methylase
MGAQNLFWSAKNMAALFVRNNPSFWDRSFAEGYWKFLQAPEQEGRHYVTAGILIRHLGGNPAKVLDVGCGYGNLARLLPENFNYLGLDLSESAVRACRENGGPARFCCGKFEEFQSNERFDALVFSELLYYYPLRSIPAIVERALELLSPHPRARILVSLNRNPKSSLVWPALQRRLRLAEEHSVSSGGSRWTVRSFMRPTDSPA